jgi:putative acetyltransferase
VSAVSLRPYLPADARRCAEIFRSSINELAADDYDEDQRGAWASRADDEQAFGARLTGALTLLAMIHGAVAASPASKALTTSTCCSSIPNSLARARAAR